MLAVFDLDETLISVDCASEWSRYMVEMNWAGDSFLESEALLMEKYHAGELDMNDYMLFMLQPLIGMHMNDVYKHGQIFAKKYIEKHMYKAAKQQVEEYLKAEDTVIVVSASPIFIVKPIAALFGISDVLAIDIETCDQGKITGRTEGTLTYRDGKVVRLKEWLGQDTKAIETARFYSDSSNDLALLQSVGYPYVVNPDKRLKEQAVKDNWPILNWQ